MMTSPVNKKLITKVTKLPSNRYTTVFTVVRAMLSLNYSHTVGDVHATFASNVPFLYTIF
jgi:hypothetical protein